MYGESSQLSYLILFYVGLSPHVRGILSPIQGLYDVNGSIPACTGNPRWLGFCKYS